VERHRNFVIVNACFGNRINETLGRMLSALLASRSGASVGLVVDPYRIILQTSVRIPEKRVVEMLGSTPPGSVETLLRAMLKNSSIMKWYLVHVGRKFGAVSKSLDVKTVSARTLLERFQGTLVFEEALERLLFDRMDVEGAESVLERIKSGDISIEISPASPMGMAGLESKNELISPERADRELLRALGDRLDRERVRLICLNCHGARTNRVGNVRDPIACPGCGGRLLAAVHPMERKAARLLERGPRTDEEKKLYNKYRKSADLVRGHGRRAVVTIMGRGVGPDTAARILTGYHEDEVELLREILKAEVNYSRTRRFWD
jgi:ATP-dependent Lhr-like helicase